MSKDLKEKAINIKGKEYVLVSDRVIYFNENYENGAIEPSYDLIGDTYHFKAVVTPDVEKPLRRFVGHSQATIGDGMVNKTAAMENAETSAVGRALAMMGIGVIESIASADEINKATGSRGTSFNKATDKQIKTIYDTVQRITGIDNKADMDAWLEIKTGVTPDKLTTKSAGAVISKLFDAESNIKSNGITESKKELDTVVDVTDEDLEALERGELPY